MLHILHVAYTDRQASNAENYMNEIPISQLRKWIYLSLSCTLITTIHTQPSESNHVYTPTFVSKLFLARTADILTRFRMHEMKPGINKL